MDTNSSMTIEQQKKGRLMLMLLVFFFSVPLIAVMLMIKFDWRPDGKSAGELVNPARLLIVPSEIQNAKGQPMPQFWRDKWTMLYIANQCDQECMKRLYDIRQIHVSTYKDIFRVQRVLITHQKEVSDIQKNYPHLIILNQPDAEIENFVTQFKVNEKDAWQDKRVYFIDPLGHLMMSYPLDIAAAAIRKDLMKLLKYSWTG